MHKLLTRQLRAARDTDGNIDIDALCGIIDEAYEELDRERRLNDRAAKLIEDELMAANEQAKREHSAVLATILESAPDGMLVAAPNGNIETANAAAKKQFHAAPDDLIGCNLEKFLLIEGEAARDRCENGPENRHTGETSALTLKGKRFPVEYSITTLGSGGSARRLWIVRDITERNQFQREIMASRMRFQDFAEASSDCLWEICQDLTNVKITSSENSENANYVANLLEHIPAGRPPTGVSTASWGRLQDKISAGKPLRDICISTFRTNGQKLDIMLSGKPARDTNGIFIGYRGTARDISQEIVARDSAKRAQRRMVSAMNAAPSAIALVDAQ